MARPFPLAALLRLRQIQRDQAASDFAVADARYRETTARERQARTALGATSAEVVDTSTLIAVAASRAAARSTLAELTALDGVQLERREKTAAEFAAARSRSIGLEKLEQRHIETVASGELLAEQAALDEVASTGWQRRTGEGAR
ncbi:MAG TPA: hypothetical protein VGC18_04820 [Lacisediminihabitans sp.]|uniref:hypothetical protein n=1 Tax=Lacisediminihabitans sp. TaxID=2787631 RepID=UPI002EDA7E6C